MEFDSNLSQPRSVPEGTPNNSPIFVINHMESSLAKLDEQQQDVAYKYYDGVQRIRGLAGSGKTVTFAQRTAQIHKDHPDWKIGFIFFTRSLYQQIIQERIAQYYSELSDGEVPNWENLKVLHSWGAIDRNGFYRTLCQHYNFQPKSVNDVKKILGNQISPGEAFEYICDELEQLISKNYDKYDELYDVILIDEGQDLPPSFYRIARNSLCEPKRLYWAYDEAQGIGSLIVPEPSTIFGRHPDGSLVVDIRGRGRAENYNICYRTPKQILMIAHAINMGLLRQDGVLQGVSDQDQWKNLGYEVIEGDFTQASVKDRKLVKIQRQEDKNPHPIDQSDFPYKEALGETIKLETFQTIEEEQIWIARQVDNDIKQGFLPQDILITPLCGEKEKEYLSKLKEELKKYNIKSIIVGQDSSKDDFMKEGCVTISNIYRAKGNEAYKVYACRFDCATKPLEWKKEDEIHKRNEGLVALTRTRIWCVVTGLESQIFDELKQAKAQFPYLIFPAFNKTSLKRVTDQLLEIN